jgi:hypothetical protein
MSTATTTSLNTGQPITSRTKTQPTITPTTQLERSAAQRLRTTMAAVRSEASGYWRAVTLPFPEAGIRLVPQNSLGMFASTMETP